METLYPLRFTPLLKQYIWGGRKLGSSLGKPLGPEDNYAESWEVVDHASGQSVVSDGPLTGWSLQDVVKSFPEELFGRHAASAAEMSLAGRFPLLFKYLDCRKDLSVQVHPDDARGKLLSPPDLGKTEAWLVLAAEPGSVLFAGLKRGFDRELLAREVSRGTTELCLHRVEPQVGDCFFIPAGVVHALGAGLLVAEIQQASDTTYRLFDWNRLGPDGQPRTIHVTESLEAIDYARGPVSAQVPQVTDRPHVQRLVSCDKFVLDRWSLSSQQSAPASVSNQATDFIGGDERFHIVSVLQGEAQLASGGKLEVGQTILIPASVGKVTLNCPSSSLLIDMYLP